MKKYDVYNIVARAEWDTLMFFYGVALMGQARGVYTFFSHLKWTWAVGLGYAASILVHLWLNGEPGAVQSLLSGLGM